MYEEFSHHLAIETDIRINGLDISWNTTLPHVPYKLSQLPNAIDAGVVIFLPHQTRTIVARHGTSYATCSKSRRALIDSLPVARLLSYRMCNWTLPTSRARGRPTLYNMDIGRVLPWRGWRGLHLLSDRWGTILSN
jgi:hypothetical protein